MAATIEDVIDRLYEDLKVAKITEHNLRLEGPSFGSIKFTGWKPGQNTDLYFSQFCWYPPKEVWDRWHEDGGPEPPCYVACVPLGFCGSYTMGQSFDLNIKEDHCPITRKTPMDVVHHEIRESLHALIDFVLDAKPEWLKIFDQNQF